MLNQQWTHDAFLPTADPTYRLPRAAHDRLCHLLNASAFEALLARLKPEPRNELLETTLELVSRGKVALGPIFSDVVDEPELIELFAKVARAPSRDPLEPGG